MTTLDLPIPAPSAAALLPSLFPPAPAVKLAEHLAHFGPAPTRGASLIDDVEAAGLRGRGGAGFPTAIKMRAVAADRRPVVVANGTEGEPASAKDKTLMSTVPHLVLDGIVAAADAVGARDAVLCVERSASRCIRVLEQALAERGAARLDRVKIRIEATPERYVAGEASALVHWLNGGEAKPTFSLHHLSDAGVGGRPTLVDNVETLAHIALIARHGARWFRGVGTAGDPGSALVTVSGAAERPGVYEIPMGAHLASILAAAGVDPPAVEAVLVGGYFGTWVPGRLAGDVTLDAASLGNVGATFGCGALAVLPAGACGLAEAARVTRWLADQNAGQCGPCVVGLPAIADAMDRLVAGDRSGRVEKDVHRWLGLINGRGACKHPDGAARFVESSLRAFHDDLVAHRHRGPCRPSAPILATPRAGAWR
ncbi:MAG: NADH-ubiquinone oxidoreductase-F iron-sulfur binding region domain-containing protein [Acidimicrobiales bacterium]